MGFKKQMRTTGKVEIPEGARKEAELLYLHNIVTIVEKYQIPHSLIMDLYQTPLNYIPATQWQNKTLNLVLLLDHQITTV